MQNQESKQQEPKTENQRREYTKPVLVKEEGWATLTGLLISGGG